MYQEDRKILDLKESKNKLETMCYNYRDGLQPNGIYESFIEEAPKQEFLKTILDTIEWLYAAGENATLEEYTSRINVFTTQGEPVKKRAFFYNEIPSSFKRFEDLAVYCEQQLANIAHLTDAQRDSVCMKVTNVREFMTKIKTEIETRPKFADPSTTIAEVDNKIDLLKAECKSIFATPVPKVEPAAEVQEPSEPKMEAPTEPEI